MERLSQNRGNTWSLNGSRLPRPLPPLTSDQNVTRRDEKAAEASSDSMDYQTEKGVEYSLPSISSLLFYAGNGSDRSHGINHSRKDSTRSIYIPESNMQDYIPGASTSPTRRTSWSEDMSHSIAYTNSWPGVCHAETVAHRRQRLDRDLDLRSNLDLDRNPDQNAHTGSQGDSTLLEASEIPTVSQPWAHHHHSAPSTSLSATQTLDRYVCSQCTKTFSRPSSLRIHSHSHTGEKPFICPHSGCGKAFSVRSNMKRHERGCHSARA
ncbi:hypothetical protein TWF281_009859 [Arthrobotrys megalospora]